MGIMGLTTYIENRSDYYLKPFKLHDTTLIVDGWSLNAQLYSAVISNHLFGGDYDIIYDCIFRFFTDLLKCKVTPLVILDGGWENKKHQTMIHRIKQRIITAGHYKAGKQMKTFFPLLLPEVFIDVMRNLGISYAVVIYEADDIIASLSKVLNVPVLSYDSDFFIYGVEYIPFNTLDPYITKKPEGFVKRCRIYRVETLLHRFKGLDVTVLPLASILLGNDYIDRRIFAEFLSRLKVKATKNQNEQQRRIGIVFRWLRDHSLNSAIPVILERLPDENRKEILQSIETIINGYSSLSSYMLRQLGIDEKIIVDNQKNFKSFTFDDNLDKLENINRTTNDVEIDITLDQEIHYEKNDEIEYIDRDKFCTDWNEEKFVALVPEWFMKDHLAGKFPGYFVNILTHRIYALPVQIEDYSCCSAHHISFPIITSICSLLTIKSCEPNCDVILLIRKDYRLVSHHLPVPPSTVTLSDIRNLSVIERKKIIDDTLQIRVNDKLNEFPPSWQLYIAVILFWMRQKDEIERTKLHLDSLLMCMLIGIINRTIGSNRINKRIVKKYKMSSVINEKRKHEKIIGNDESIVMTNLINSVTEAECLAAAPFFLDHAVNKKLYLIPKTFDVRIVHVCAQFQSCLRHAMHLNALLGHIYIQPLPNEFLSGAMFYNLYCNFSTRPDVHTYIATKLKDSVTLIQVFQTISQKISDALQDTEIDGGLKKLKRKRRRHRNKNSKITVEKNDSSTAQSEDDIESCDGYTDPSNLFSRLHAT